MDPRPTKAERADAAKAMREDHRPEHERHQMWSDLALLLDRLAGLAPYWMEPYAAPFVPIIEAGVRVSGSYMEARTTHV